jgi:DNA-binding response OmpR family regulator
MSGGPPVVAIFNTSPDTVEMLRIIFEHNGFVVTSAFTYEIRDGKVDVEMFVRQHHPDVIVYDIAPPYEKNWREFQHVCTMDAFKGTQFLLTTTNVHQVQKVAGEGYKLYEVVGKPYDLGLIIDAVKKLTGQASDRRESTSASSPQP